MASLENAEQLLGGEQIVTDEKSAALDHLPLRIMLMSLFVMVSVGVTVAVLAAAGQAGVTMSVVALWSLFFLLLWGYLLA
jgi:hypothetical protein